MPNVAERALSTGRRVFSRTGKYAKGLIDDTTNLVGSTTSSVSSVFTSNTILSNVIVLVLLVYAVFVVNQLNARTLAMFDNTVVRLVVVLVILGLAVSGQNAAAILLTVGFVMSIQAANRSQIAKFANLAVTSNANETFYAGRCGQNASHTNKETFASHSDHDHVVSEEDDVFPTNVQASANDYATENVPPTFTTSGQFNAIQNNQVSPDNQNTEVRTWKEELGPQGLTQPAGFDGGDSSPASFDANTCTNGSVVS